jgi:hypothetical protein
VVGVEGRRAAGVAGLDRRVPRALALVAYLAAAAGILVARRPDAVLRPQFWAEDGAVFYAGADGQGAGALLVPDAGYLVLVPRLAAFLAQPLDLAAAPALFNLVGLIFQLAPALFVLSSRFEHAVPSLVIRALIGVVYLMVPNAEVHATVTNAQWHLAILMCMVVIAAPGRGVGWRVLDIAVLILGGLTGPFVLVVAPLMLLRWVTSHRRWYGVLSGLTAALAGVQLGVILHGGRPEVQLGAGARSLIRILVDRIVMPGITGVQNPAIYSLHWWHGLIWATMLVLGVVALAGHGMLRGPAELRILLAFSAITLTLSLLTPKVTPTGPQWPPLVEVGQMWQDLIPGGRYFLIPTVGFLVLVIWAVSRLPRPVRAAAGVLLISGFLGGTASQPQYLPHPDQHLAAYASRLRAASSGTVVDVPINPLPMHMALRKH